MNDEPKIMTKPLPVILDELEDYIRQVEAAVKEARAAAEESKGHAAEAKAAGLEAGAAARKAAEASVTQVKKDLEGEIAALKMAIDKVTTIAEFGLKLARAMNIAIGAGIRAYNAEIDKL